MGNAHGKLRADPNPPLIPIQQNGEDSAKQISEHINGGNARKISDCYSNFEVLSLQKIFTNIKIYCIIKYNKLELDWEFEK